MFGEYGVFNHKPLGFPHDPRSWIDSRIDCISDAQNQGKGHLLLNAATFLIFLNFLNELMVKQTKAALRAAFSLKIEL